MDSGCTNKHDSTGARRRIESSVVCGIESIVVRPKTSVGEVDNEASFRGEASVVTQLEENQQAYVFDICGCYCAASALSAVYFSGRYRATSGVDTVRTPLSSGTTALLPWSKAPACNTPHPSALGISEA